MTKQDMKDSLFEDRLLLEFKKWFKTEFFSWVDNPPCPQCSVGSLIWPAGGR